MQPINEGLTFWIESRILAEPGIWTARLCRVLNGIPETLEGIKWCGLCAHYANPRKRARAETWAALPTLPGMKPPYQLHPPCRAMPFKKLQYLLVQYENNGYGNIQGKFETIPDLRQARGWDYAWRWYPR